MISFSCSAPPMPLSAAVVDGHLDFGFVFEYL
jgi:hypothetical protein